VEWDVTTLFHDYIATLLSGLLLDYVRRRRLGMAVGGDPHIMIQGSRYDARGPDVAFYARHRIPQDLKASAAATAPDFVIEVLSPTDRAGAVLEKTGDWLRAGVRLLWYVNPETGNTIVYHDGRVYHVAAHEVLDGGDTVPGFTVRLADIYQELAELQSPAEKALDDDARG